jgi:aspartyl-tRNA(Asn)/glutamyl-tRNA(Gln) amidotransferase subunit C
MPLSNEEILHLAKLARLALPPEGVEAYREKLGSVLAYVAKLSALDTEGVEEMQHGADVTNVWREDVARACDADERERMIAAFPAREGDLLSVQAVFQDRTR